MNAPRREPFGRLCGFTVVELVVVMFVIGTFAGLALSRYVDYLEKARVALAVAQIRNLARAIDGHALDEGVDLPASLLEVDQSDVHDPWGRPYQYQPLTALAAGTPLLPPVAAPPPGVSLGKGAVISVARKDGFLVPINSDYDLYSMGKDGQSRASLRARHSLDDVIRAADGSYVGLARDY